MDRILRLNGLNYVPMVLIGNICDLVAERQVETLAGEHLAALNNAGIWY